MNIIEASRILRDIPIKSKKDLDNYLRSFMGVYLAKKPLISGNSSPLDFVFDIYSTCLDQDRIDPHYSVLGMGARGSGKTLAVAALEALLLIHDRHRDLFHMASIFSQSFVCYNYVRDFFKNEILIETLAEPPKKGNTTSRYGRSLQIGTGTMDSVNSYHGSVLLDECDLLDPSVFREAKGMLSAFQGHLPINVMISSRKFAHGNIQKILNDQADGKSDVFIHRWGILETTQKCSDKRSGKIGTEIYVNDENLIALSKAQYDELPSGDKTEFVKNIGYENCLSCGIFSFCKGNLKKQDDDNHFLQPIELTRSLFKNDAPEFFKSQRLNMKPSTIGLVYPQWNEEIHRKNTTSMWEIITGDKLPHGIYKKLEDVVRLLINSGASLCIALDFGFHNAHALLLAFDKRDRCFVLDEVVCHLKTDLEYILNIKEAWGDLPIETCYPDIADASAVKTLQDVLGFHVTTAIIKSHDEGFNIVRNFLRTPGTMDSQMWVNSDCVILSEQMALLHMKVDRKSDSPTETVEKENDHGCFVAGTMITCQDGDKPIESLKIGDLVLTRDGYKPVIDWAMTSENAEVWQYSFSNGFSLTGTSNHPIYVKNKDDFIEIGRLSKEDLLYGNSLNDGREIQLLGSIFKGRAPVYNITVKDKHEYFGNGLLLKNCDALRYALMTRYGRSRGNIVSGSTSKLYSSKAHFDPKSPIVAPNAAEVARFLGNNRFDDNSNVIKLKDRKRRKIIF